MTAADFDLASEVKSTQNRHNNNNTIVPIRQFVEPGVYDLGGQTFTLTGRGTLFQIMSSNVKVTNATVVFVLNEEDAEEEAMLQRGFVCGGGLSSVSNVEISHIRFVRQYPPHFVTHVPCTVYVDHADNFCSFYYQFGQCDVKWE